MKKLFLIALMGIGAWGHLAAQQGISSRNDSIAFAIGQDIGKNLKQSGVSLNVDLIYQGLIASMKGEGETLPQETVNYCIQEFQKSAQAHAIQQRMELAQANKAEGDAFLAENAQKEGISVTASGLQYEVLREGTGNSPADTSSVEVHYKGMLLDGKTFDSSYDRGEPLLLQVNRVISGWTEGLQLMKEGAHYKFYIPSDLGYGERGTQGGEIPPNAVLVFEVELLSVK